MESIGTKQALEKIVSPDMVNAALSASASVASQPRQARSSSSGAPKVAMEHRVVGYGLPCAHCRAYYPSDMSACPICKSPERISIDSVGQVTTTASATAAADGAKSLSEERERLRELKSQIYSQVPATTFRCALDQKHDGNVEPAAICHSCYGEVRQQADRLEAALHMDMKEAAKIVYDAVWADTSDPNKTYLNAASALLTELRKRAGVAQVLGANQPLAH